MTALGIEQTNKTVQMTQQQAVVDRKVASLKGIDMKKIDEAAQEFEAVFLTEMLRPMFEEVNQPDPLFGGGKGEEIFSNLILDEYGKQMAAQGGIGIAQYVRDEMIRIQEAAHAR